MRYVFLILGGLLMNMPTMAETVYLVDQKGKRLEIATITFEKTQGATTYELTFKEDQFGDYFLSMRPFRCHEAERLICRQPYPYPLERTLSDTHLVPLEYDLMFISRLLGDYGIDPYHGRYYVLEKTNTGYQGTVHAVDLNTLAAPPDEGVTYPITSDILDEMEADSVVFPTLVIE